MQSYLTTILRHRYYYSYSVLKKKQRSSNPGLPDSCLLCLFKSLDPPVGLCFQRLQGFWLAGSHAHWEGFSRTGPRSLGQDYHGPRSRSLQKSAEFLQRGGFAAAPVKELARCVERNKNPRNVVPVGVIHHRGTDGPCTGLPGAPALSPHI